MMVGGCHSSRGLNGNPLCDGDGDATMQIALKGHEMQAQIARPLDDDHRELHRDGGPWPILMDG